MGVFLSVLLLKGRLSRVPYALVAIPILLLMESRRFVAYLAPLIFQKLGGGLEDMAGLTWLFLGYNALVLPLFIVSFNRLHDLRLTGWLALPYLVVFAGQLMIGWIAAYHADLSFPNALTLTSQFCYAYSIILALTLLVVPGRKARVCPLPVNS